MAAFGCPKGISWCTALGALHLIASLVSRLVWSCSNCQWEQGIKRKKNWNWKNTERGESPSENEISCTEATSGCFFWMHLFIICFSYFFLLPISITLRFSRTDDIVKPSWASAVLNTSQHGLGSISLKSCHVAISQNQSQSKSLTSKICWCFLIIIHFHFALCQLLFCNWMWTECHVMFIAIVSFWVILLAHKASIWLGFPTFAKLVMDRLVSYGGRWKQGLQNKTIRGQVVAIVGQCKTLHEFSFRSQRN